MGGRDPTGPDLPGTGKAGGRRGCLTVLAVAARMTAPSAESHPSRGPGIIGRVVPVGPIPSQGGGWFVEIRAGAGLRPTGSRMGMGGLADGSVGSVVTPGRLRA